MLKLYKFCPFLSRAIKNNLFKLAFQGAMGNVWGTLMSIPEVKYYYINCVKVVAKLRLKSANPK